MFRLVVLAALCLSAAHGWKGVAPASRSAALPRALTRRFVKEKLPELSQEPTGEPAQQTMLSVDEEAQDEGKESSLPVWLDPGTNGGVIGLSVLGIAIPIAVYNVLIGPFGLDPDTVGSSMGVGFVVIAVIGWTASYLLRVANKDMTYAKQLRDYENAVIAKRLEELDEDEVQALMEEVDDNEF